VYAQDNNIWESVNYRDGTLDTSIGIGTIVGRSTSTFALHDHHYATLNIPDPYRAKIIYEFDTPVTVDRILVTQHQNGITRVEGFAGDELNGMRSVGVTWGPKGDVIGESKLTERQDEIFNPFPTPSAGRFFQVVILKSSLPNGYALYRLIPLTTYIE